MMMMLNKLFLSLKNSPMLHFLKVFFGGKKIKTKSKEFINKMKEISKLSNDINNKKEKLYDAEYELLQEQEEELYIPLKDFMELIKKENIKIDDIMSVCKHVTEIDSSKFSFIDVYAIEESDHITLCSDKESCNKHIGFNGDPIRIVTWRRN